MSTINYKAPKSEYGRSLTGQFEYWLLTIVRTAFHRNLDKWPSTYYGGLNSIELYLDHPSYSPFVKQPKWLTEPMETGWRQDTADYVAEQLRREEANEPRQVLAQELVWCEECGAKPGNTCGIELPHEKRLARYRRGILTDKEFKAMAKNLNAIRLPSLE